MCADTGARASPVDTYMRVSVPQKPLKSYLGASLKTNTPRLSIGSCRFTLDSRLFEQRQL